MRGYLDKVYEGGGSEDSFVYDIRRSLQDVIPKINNLILSQLILLIKYLQLKHLKSPHNHRLIISTLNLIISHNLYPRNL